MIQIVGEHFKIYFGLYKKYVSLHIKTLSISFKNVKIASFEMKYFLVYFLLLVFKFNSKCLKFLKIMYKSNHLIF